MKEQTNELAVKINALMLNKGITRKELAAKIGVSAQFFIHIANGQMPAADKLVKLASALGVSAEWLLFDTDVNVPSWAIDLATVCARLDDSDKDAIIAFAELYQERKDIIEKPGKISELDLVIIFAEFLKNRQKPGGRWSTVVQKYEAQLKQKREETEKLMKEKATKN